MSHGYPFRCFRRNTVDKPTALKLISEYDHSIVKTLFDSKEYNSRSLLQWAGIRGWSDVCEMLINNHHCDPFYEDDNKRNVLHNVCRNGHIDLVRYFVSKPFQMDPSKKNKDGTTPLDFSKRHGYTDITKYLEIITSKSIHDHVSFSDNS